jgi:hypothetical protein
MHLIDVLIIHVEEIQKIVLLNHLVLQRLQFYVGMEDVWLREENV